MRPPSPACWIFKISEYKTCELGSRVDVGATKLVHGKEKKRARKESVVTLLLLGCIHPLLVILPLSILVYHHINLHPSINTILKVVKRQQFGFSTVREVLLGESIVYLTSAGDQNRSATNTNNKRGAQ